MKKTGLVWMLLALMTAQVFGQARRSEQNHGERFEQLGTMLRSPNVYRTASGAPGHMYWQQKANYVIDVELNDDNQSVKGKETITYINNSPDQLTYLWVQLEENQRGPQSEAPLVAESSINSRMTLGTLQGILWENDEYGYKY